MKILIKILAAGVLAIVLAGCANIGQSIVLFGAKKALNEIAAVSDTTTETHFCAGISATDIQAILGEGYTATEGGHGRECDFAVSTDKNSGTKARESFRVNLNLYNSPEAASKIYNGFKDSYITNMAMVKLLKPEITQMAPQTIDGLGDNAYWIHNQDAYWMAQIVDGRKQITAIVFSPSEDDAVLLNKVTALVKLLSAAVK